MCDAAAGIGGGDGLMDDGRRLCRRGNGLGIERDITEQRVCICRLKILRALQLAPLPMDVISAKADGSVSSVATLKPRTEIVAGEADIAEIARRIDEAGSIVIMCGAGCHGV